MSTQAAGSPAQFSLSVATGVKEEFERWREGVSPMFDIAPLSEPELAAFTMETLGYFLPGMAITTTTSSPCTFERPPALIARSGIDNILVQFYVTGGYRLSVEGVAIAVDPGDVVAFDLTRECRIEATAYTNIACTLQRDMLTPLVVAMDGLHGLVLRNGEPRNNLIKSHLQALHAEAPHIAVTEQPAVVNGTAALIAACLGPSLDRNSNRAVTVEARTTLHAIRRAIDSRLDDMALSPELLASEFGISRSSIYRMFEPLGGVRNYIQQRRLMHAYQQISHPSRFTDSISVIAARLGFKDIAVFSRAFSSLYRMSPSDVRAASRNGFTAGPHAPQTGAESFGMLNRWLLGLDANAHQLGVQRVPD